MFKSLPGFRDFYPDACAIRNHLFQVWRQACRRFGFAEYDAPVLEPLELFTEKSGEEIVNQLFSFKDRGGRDVTLRAEMTPSLARMVGAKANAMRKPIKWFTIGENFRYERPQKGRLRSFYQLNADILGEKSPKADAESMALLAQCLTSFGLEASDFTIRLSDRNLWVYWLESWGVKTPDSQTAVLSIIDKLGREAPEKTLEYLTQHFGERAQGFLTQVEKLHKIRDFKSLQAFFASDTHHQAIEERLADWTVLLDQLAALQSLHFITIDLSVVRGLAYYTGFVFEAFQTVGEGRALAGGGRFDHLVQKLGGPDVPAVGFAMGDVTLRDLLEFKGFLPQYIEGPDLFVITGDSQDARVALGDVSRLRAAGYQVEYSLKNAPMSKQFKEANQLGARFALIYGSDEVAVGEITVKDLSVGEEKRIPREALRDYLQEILG